ncbi:HAMP domain protein [Mycobacterium ulcerans str. Harvey]|uniref:HAMP domain protein n=1 Tax=Mycobacterium ulcerans str. Harvey TaxID=1299332 RepID=A0ABP3AJN4_MYCUL|nr:HAMP domain protein [Mycobacterium ulcerans str. Harvey]
MGIILAVAFAMSQQHLTRNDLGLVLLLLAPAALVSGVLCNMIAAWLTATSVRDLHSALKRVESGDLDCQLDVFDGTELGELQRGFNAMVEGCASVNGSGTCSAVMSGVTAPLPPRTRVSNLAAKSAASRFFSWTSSDLPVW